MALELTIPPAPPRGRRREVEVDLLVQALARIYGGTLPDYAQPFLQDRIESCLAAEGLPSFSALFARVLDDEGMARRLLRHIVRQEETFLDHADHLRALRYAMASTLSSFPAPKVWLPECAAIEDVVALAALAREAGLHERTTIFVTSSSEETVRELRAASLSMDRLSAYERTWQESGALQPLAGLVSGQEGQVVPDRDIGVRIAWVQFNPATDGSFNEFQLVASLMPASILNADGRRRLFRLYRDSVPYYGLLYLGRGNWGEDQHGTSAFGALSMPGMFRRMAS